MTPSDRVRAVRNSLNLTTTIFGKELGVTQGNISQIENGRQNPSLEIMSTITKRWGIDAHWLLTGEGEMFPTEAKYFGEINIERLRRVIIEIVRVIDKYPQIRLTPEQKADIVLLYYEEYSMEENDVKMMSKSLEVAVKAMMS